MNKRRKNGSLLFGIIFIALAINMLLSQLKILDINIFNIVLSFILMSYGIYALIKRNFTFGFLGILFGLKISSEYYQDYVDFSNINNFTIFLIAILLGF